MPSEKYVYGCLVNHAIAHIIITRNGKGRNEIWEVVVYAILGRNFILGELYGRVITFFCLAKSFQFRIKNNIVSNGQLASPTCDLEIYLRRTSPPTMGTHTFPSHRDVSTYSSKIVPIHAIKFALFPGYLQFKFHFTNFSSWYILQGRDSGLCFLKF